MNELLNRRDVLKRLGIGAASAAVLATGLPTPAAGGATKSVAAGGAKRMLRVGHLTDLRIQPERGAVEGVAQCLRHVQSQADKPDLLLVTGDCNMDGFKRDAARTKLQWDLWTRVWRAENSLPVEVALGNHDILSHIPIISIAAMLGPGTDEPNVGMRLGHAAMRQDGRRIRALFARHANVKLAISGHLHLLDRVDTGGVSYRCNGAVSGGWWKTKHLDEGDAGYTIIDFYDDGTFRHEYVGYGWTYRDAEPVAAGA